MIGIKIIPHYDFNSAIAMANIDQDGEHHDLLKFGKTKGKNMVCFDDASVGSSTRTSAKCIRVTSNSLDPVKGSLNTRLIPHLNHLAQVPMNKKDECCALHRHFTGKQIRSQLLHCSICQVVLCSVCFYLFHAEASPEKMKKKIQKDSE